MLRSSERPAGRRGDATNTDTLVQLSRDRGLATITLNSPANRNALSSALLSQLEEDVGAVCDDADIRVVVLTGTDTVFCAGADLKEQRAANEAGNTTGASPVARILERIWNAPKPFVCRVNGHARAGGIGLLAACDIAVAVDTATFAFSEVRIGVAPAMISVVVLPKLGPVRGMELMLTGEAFGAADAAAWGLVNQAVPADELDATTQRYIDMLLLGAPAAIAATKKLVRDVAAMPVAEAFHSMTALSAELFGSAEAREGMTAFAERRAPAWQRED